MILIVEEIVGKRNEIDGFKGDGGGSRESGDGDAASSGDVNRRRRLANKTVARAASETLLEARSQGSRL